MRIQIQFRIIGDDNSVISEDEILHFDKDDNRLEAMSFANSKAILVGIQERVVSAQASVLHGWDRCRKGASLFRCSGSRLHAAQIQCRSSPPHSAAEAARDELILLANHLRQIEVEQAGELLLV